MKPGTLSRREYLKLLLMLPALGAGRSLTRLITEMAPAASRKGQGLPNVLILVFDTLSANHMSLYGYPRETTPNFSRLADHAMIFHRHYAGGSFTTPGTASLLTGTYPWSHRAFHLHGSVTDVYTARNMFSTMKEKYFTRVYTHNPLAAILFHQFKDGIDELKPIEELTQRDFSLAESLFFQDYAVAYESELLQLRSGDTPSSTLFLSLLDSLRRSMGGSSLSREYAQAFPRGFPNYMDEKLPSFLYFTLEEAVDWIVQETSSLPAPFLQYIHLLPPHGPYTTRREFVDIFEDGWSVPAKPREFFPDRYGEAFLLEQRRLYDEFIAYVDAELGRLLDRLRETDQLDKTYLIVTSDHGQLFERGIHGHLTPTMYEGLIRIPLVIFKPGQKKRTDIFTPTSCVDLLPTLLHLSGQRIPDWCEGEILPGIGAPAPTGRNVFCVDAKSNAKHKPLTQGSVALINENHKLVRYFGQEGIGEAFELFDLQNDPHEQENLYDRTSSVAVALREELMERLGNADEPFK